MRALEGGHGTVRQPGESIRKYTLKKQLGAGGMGEVWLAATSGPHGFTKNVCIKTMLSGASAFLEYFTTEARLGGRLTHSNLVNVFDFFEESGEYFIVMEYIEGLNVKELLSTVGALPPEMACFIAAAVLKGLHFAHVAALDGPGRGGLIHRDISPDNILVSADAEVKLSDFGIAQLEVAWREKTRAPNGFRGKFYYASPEHLLGRAIDGRADVYQVGVVLYQMLAGAHPFGHESSMYAVTRMVVEGDCRPIGEARPEVSGALDRIVMKMMQPDRDARFTTADAARAALLNACPELGAADRPLAELVLDLTAPNRRATSPFIRLKDLAKLTFEPPLRVGPGAPARLPALPAFPAGAVESTTALERPDAGPPSDAGGFVKPWEEPARIPMNSPNTTTLQGPDGGVRVGGPNAMTVHEIPLSTGAVVAPWQGLETVRAASGPSQFRKLEAPPPVAAHASPKNAAIPSSQLPSFDAVTAKPLRARRWRSRAFVAAGLSASVLLFAIPIFRANRHAAPNASQILIGTNETSALKLPTDIVVTVPAAPAPPTISAIDTSVAASPSAMEKKQPERAPRPLHRQGGLMAKPSPPASVAKAEIVLPSGDVLLVLWIDDVWLGKAPQRRTVDAGRHRIRLGRMGTGTIVARDVIVRAGESYEIDPGLYR